METWNKLRRIFSGISEYKQQKVLNKDRNVEVYCNYNSAWIGTFLESRIGKQPKGTWSVVGIYNQPLTPIVFNLAKFKIFYTAENVHVPESHWQRYEHLFLENRRVALSIGFDYINHPKYCRFPYWFMRHFKPTDTLENIKTRIEKWNNQLDRVART